MSLLVGGDLLGGRVAKYPECSFMELKKRRKRATRANVNHCVYLVKHKLPLNTRRAPVRKRRGPRVAKYPGCTIVALTAKNGSKPSRSDISKCIWAARP